MIVCSDPLIMSPYFTRYLFEHAKQHSYVGVDGQAVWPYLHILVPERCAVEDNLEDAALADLRHRVDHLQGRLGLSRSTEEAIT